MTEAELRALADRYAGRVDRREWALMDEVFAPAR
jgi:hypothetical protein